MRRALLVQALPALGSALAGGFSGASQPAFDAKGVNSLPELQAAYRDKKISAAEARNLAIARGWAKAPAGAPQPGPAA